MLSYENTKLHDAEIQQKHKSVGGSAIIPSPT